MSRFIQHICRNPSCGGTEAKWCGPALFCTSCDAWQRDKVSLAKKSDPTPRITRKRIWTDIKNPRRVATVEFECGACGEMNVTPNFKKIEEDERVKYQVQCFECSTKGYVSP